MSTEAVDWKRFWGRASDHGIGSAFLDVDAYVSPETYELEKEKIFRKTWIAIARESELSSSGDFIKQPIYPLDTEVIVARDRSGRINAFYNSCPHRGAALVQQNDGRTGLFVCPYHAWAFDLDGRCKAIRGEEHFPHLNRRDVRLTSIPVDVWNGFVFINLQTEPSQTLAEYMGPFGELFADVPFEDYECTAELVYDLHTNWKNFVDAFNEGYHVDVVHRRTLPGVPTGDNPLCVYMDPILMKPHSAATIERNAEWKGAGPVTALANSVLHDLGRGARREAPRPLTSSRAINRIGNPNYLITLINVFPLTQFEVQSDRYLWFQFWPLGPDKTRCTIRTYFAGAATSYLEEFSQVFAAVALRDITTEDAAMTRIQQRGMKNGGVKKIALGENECMLRFTRDVVSDYLSR